MMEVGNLSFLILWRGGGVIFYTYYSSVLRELGMENSGNVKNRYCRDSHEVGFIFALI